MKVLVTDIAIEGHPFPVPECGILVEGETSQEIVANALKVVPIPAEAFAFNVAWIEEPVSSEPHAKASFGTYPAAVKRYQITH